MEAWKNPQLYKTLGEFAYSLGKGGTPYATAGAQLGQFGMQESENWAAREAREKAEKEAKKQKQGGMFGDILGTTAAIATTALGQPWLAPIAASAASALGTEAAGGDYDWEKGLTDLGINYATMGATKGIDALRSGNGITSSADPLDGFEATGREVTKLSEAPLQAAPSDYTNYGAATYNQVTTNNPAMSLSDISTLSPGGQEAALQYANAGRMGQTAMFNKAHGYTIDAPVKQGGFFSGLKDTASKALNSEYGQNALGYIDSRYGGPAGLAGYLATTGKRNEVPLSSVMKPYPGLSEEGFRDMVAAQADIENTQALADYREQSLGMQQQAFDLQRQGFDLRKQEFDAEQNAPTFRKRYDPATGLTYEDAYTKQGQLLYRGEAPISGPAPEGPKVMQTKEGDILRIPSSGTDYETIYDAPAETKYFHNRGQIISVGPEGVRRDGTPQYAPARPARPAQPQRVPVTTVNEKTGEVTETFQWLQPGQQPVVLPGNRLASMREIAGAKSTESAQDPYKQHTPTRIEASEVTAPWETVGNKPVNNPQDLAKAIEVENLAKTALRSKKGVPGSVVIQSYPDGLKADVWVEFEDGTSLPEGGAWVLPFPDVDL